MYSHSIVLYMENNDWKANIIKLLVEKGILTYVMRDMSLQEDALSVVKNMLLEGTVYTIPTHSLPSLLLSLSLPFSPNPPSSSALSLHSFHPPSLSLSTFVCRT
jgi:hypothetical protein